MRTLLPSQPAALAVGSPRAASRAGRQPLVPRGLLALGLAGACALGLCPGLALAQDGSTDPRPAPVYQPRGAPADPRVPAHWNRYRSYAEVVALCEALAERHAPRCRLERLGPSTGGRPLLALVLTNPATAPEAHKAAFYIDGGIHANEIQGVEVALYTAWYLLESYGRNAFVTKLLDERVFYIVPSLSPDARDAHLFEPNTTHSPRSGVVPVDDDLDGLVDEDGYDDLDGDGSITTMRIRDPNGRWKEHPRYPNLMVRCEPDEPGQFTLLGWEGIDRDGDGRMNEDGPGGYDPNRDWPWQWEPRSVQWGAYHYPLSIPENRLVAEFAIARPNIAGSQSYHNAGGMILRGPGPKGERYPPDDIRVFDAIAKQGELMLPQYRYLDVADGLYPVFGGEFDWFYAMRGALTFTNELFTSWNLFRKSAEEGGFFGRDEDLHAFDRFLLFGDGVTPWTEVEHPQLGRIEVGGLRKEWLRQPPSFLLEEECHRNMAFTLYHADQMPKVEVQSIASRALGGGLREVTATIANPKVIPTRLAIDVQHAISPPDRVELTGEGVEVLAGIWSFDPFLREATVPERHRAKRTPARLDIERIPSMGAAYARWIVRGAGPVTVTVRSQKGGVASRTSP